MEGTGTTYDELKKRGPTAGKRAGRRVGEICDDGGDGSGALGVEADGADEGGEFGGDAAETGEDGEDYVVGELRITPVLDLPPTGFYEEIVKAVEVAEKLQASLNNENPSFVKSVLRSHVCSCFWLYCRKVEDGKQYPVFDQRLGSLNEDFISHVSHLAGFDFTSEKRTEQKLLDYN